MMHRINEEKGFCHRGAESTEKRVKSASSPRRRRSICYAEYRLMPGVFAPGRAFLLFDFIDKITQFITLL